MSLLAFANDFTLLFSEMNPLVILLFVLGLVFCFIELFIPGFGFFGISGGIMILLGIIIRMLNGGTLAMLVYMLLIFGVVLTLMIVFFSRSVRKGVLGKTAIFSVGTAVPEDKTEGTKDFTDLQGKEGVVVADLHPVGRASIDGQMVDVIARDGFVEKGANVVVVEVEGQRVIVIEK